MRLETLIMAQLGKMDSHSLLGYYRVKRMLDCPMDVMQTQINRAIGSAINDKVLPGIEIIKQYAFGSNRHWDGYVLR